MPVQSDLTRRITQAAARAQFVVDKTAMDISAGAMARTKRVDTGAMKSGWQTRSTGVEFEREVINPIHYAVFHEHGTRHMTAQPMLAPAVEDAREPFIQAIRHVFSG